MSIGQKIKEAREQKQMTLDEVAKLCNTTRQTIFKYENEIVTNIPYDKILLLTKALKVTPSYLFEWDENETPIPETRDERSKMAMELFAQLSDVEKDLFLRQLKGATSKE